MVREAVVEVSRLQAPSAEDRSRADWYALLAALLLAPPDAGLLGRIAAAGRDLPAQSAADPDAQAAADSGLSRAFLALSQACASARAEAIRAEYDAAFLGVGKPEVFLNASYYLTGFLHERPLADLRDRLAGLGLARREDVGFTEDHAGALCETMRWMILEGAARGIDLRAQRALFAEFIAPCVEPLCDALESSAATGFYKHVGRLAREFFAVERQAFDFDS